VEVRRSSACETPKGTYLAYRCGSAGKATVDVLPDVLAGLLRDLTFPKQMRWDAYLDDGKGELVFGRPIRWLLFLYGGRVVPFVIRALEQAQGPTRAGRPLRRGHLRPPVPDDERPRRPRHQGQDFDDYRRGWLENFVILDRSERDVEDRRELDAHARRLGGRGSAARGAVGAAAGSARPGRVPVGRGRHFAPEFLELPEEVLTTTMIHHQHFFPVVDDDPGRLKPAFLAVTNTQPGEARGHRRNAERVLTARLRDARFFWDEPTAGARSSRGSIGSTRAVPQGARELPREGRARRGAGAVDRRRGVRAAARGGRGAAAERAGGCARPTSPPTWCASSPSCRARWAASTRARKGSPRRSGRRSTTTTCRWASRPTRRRPAAQLGAAAVTWAAVSLADKLDTVVGPVRGGRAADRIARSARPAAAGAGRR
jgi:glycyl-tRNA synthetase beta subunit